ncbi:MAG: hypothetical protein IRZ28_21715 [Steroidobacteraceae bacterium]|nr:hypothetical protein [Steroidobacteraceae bacterium]
MREYTGDDPLGFVVSMNLHRRHLTEGQKAALALELLPHLEARARERQLATLKQNTDPEIIPERREPEGESREQAARMVGTNPRYVSDAKKLAQESPELFAKVKTGNLSIPAAKRQLAPKASGSGTREGVRHERAQGHT